MHTVLSSPEMSKWWKHLIYVGNRSGSTWKIAIKVNLEKLKFFSPRSGKFQIFLATRKLKWLIFGGSRSTSKNDQKQNRTYKFWKLETEENNACFCHQWLPVPQSSLCCHIEKMVFCCDCTPSHRDISTKYPGGYWLCTLGRVVFSVLFAAVYISESQCCFTY